MITTNAPFTYAFKSGNTIYLYVLVYAGSAPTFPNEGTRMDATVSFSITGGSAGTTPYTRYYAFPILPTGSQVSLTDIKLTYGNHLRHIEVADIETQTPPSQTPPFDAKAIGAPYSYTQQVNSNLFRAEIALFAETAQKFDCNHSPNPPDDGVGDTTSTIVISQQATLKTEFTDTHEFNVSMFRPTSGSHIVSNNSNPGSGRRTKTKNRNHSQTPFPRRRRRT